MKKGLRKVISLSCALSMLLSCVPFHAVSDGEPGFEQEDILLPELTETADPAPAEEEDLPPAAEPDGEPEEAAAPEAPADETDKETTQETVPGAQAETDPAAPAEPTPDTPAAEPAEEPEPAGEVPGESGEEEPQEPGNEEPPAQEPGDEEPAAQETEPDDPDKVRADRVIDLSGDPEQNDLETAGTLAEGKAFVIRILSRAETDLFFVLEGSAALDAELTDEEYGQIKPFVKVNEDADAEGGEETEDVPERTRSVLTGIHFEQDSSRLVHINGDAGTTFSLRVLTPTGWAALQAAGNEPAEDGETEPAGDEGTAAEGESGGEPQQDDPAQGGPDPEDPAEEETAEEEPVPEELPAFEITEDILVRYNGGDETVTVPDGIREIGSRAFCGNETLRTVILPDSVEMINNSAFADCVNLETVEISEQSGLTTIGHLAFRNDVKLDLSFAANVPNIMDTTFEGAGISAGEEETGEDPEVGGEENEEDSGEDEEDEDGEEPDEDAEDGEGEEEPLPQESPLVFEGEDYTVTVTFGEDAGFLQGTELNVREILPGTEEYLLYSGQTEEVLNENWDEVAEFARYFDITFIYNEEEIEPLAPIDVQVTFAEAISVAEDSSLQAIHFADEGAQVIDSDTDSVEAAAEDDSTVDTVAFSSDSFSVYGFVQTAKITERVIAADGSAYRIEVTYEQDSGIPLNAGLAAAEILPGDERYETLLQEALAAAGRESAAYARFFDIEILANEEEIEPQDNVSVRMTLDDVLEAEPEELKIVHFAEEETVVLDAETGDDSGILFETDSFSVYGVIATETSDVTVNNLDGRTFRIAHNSQNGTQYATAIISPGDTNQFLKTTNPDDAAIWRFESAGENGKYYISTSVDGVKQYMRLERWSDTSAHAALGSEPQVFTATDTGNGTLALSVVFGNTSYYLNEFNRGRGFAGWYQRSSNYDRMTLTPAQPQITPGKDYAVIIKYNDSYYSVKPDGTLEPAAYDPATNTVQMEYPLTWHYNNNRLYVETEGKTFNGYGNTADSFYYRYISTDRANGLYDEHENQGETSNTELQYSGHKLRGSGSNAGRYIGVEDANGTLRIVGQQGEASAAEVYLANVSAYVPAVSAKNHTVTHLDISIHGNAEASYPLPGGTYYYENGETLVVDKANPKTLELSASPAITKEDIKNAELTATDKNGNTVDNAYYITGYSGNKGDDNENPDKPTQIRIEGSFKVANNITVPYPTGNPPYPDDVNEADKWNELQYNEAHQTIRQQRRDNQITYTVTVTKNVTFPVKDGDRELYDADGKPLTITVPVSLTGSCEYWSPKNTCPGITLTGSENQWRNGCIIGDGHTTNSSGIDFILGGRTNLEGPDYPTVVINKYIVDSGREPLSIDGTVTNSFTIYQINNDTDDKKAAVPGTDYSQYQYAGKLNVDVTDANGLGSIGVGSCELSVESAMVYIREDNSEDALPRTIEVDGETWKYARTVIETECVRTDDPDTHTTGDLTPEDTEYNSKPEIAGIYIDNSGRKFQEKLHFYVYNIYEPELAVTVEKEWEDGNENHAGESVQVQLVRYKKSGGEEPPVPETGTLTISHSSSGLPGSPALPEGFAVTYSCNGEPLFAGENTVAPGTYEVTATVTVTNGAAPNGYEYRSTNGPITVTVPAGGTGYAEFTSTYSIKEEAGATVHLLVGYYPGNNTIEYKSITVPHNSNVILNYNHFSVYYSQYHADQIRPTWKMYYGIANYYSEAGFSGNCPDGAAVSVPIGERDDYYICIEMNPQFLQDHSEELNISLSAQTRGNSAKKTRINPGHLIASTGGVYRSASGAPEGYTVDDSFNGSVTLSEGNEWFHTFTGLPVYDDNGNEYYYELLEEVPEGYVASYDPEGPWKAEAGEKTFKVTNELLTGDLTVFKTVTGNAGETDRAFEFTITLTNYPGLNRTYGDVTFENGTARIYLKHGESKTIPGLPANAEYTVTETEANTDGYTTTIPGNASGTITTAGKTVTFINKKSNGTGGPQFVVKKLWRGVEVPVNYPTVTFDLYQVEVDRNGNMMGQGRIANRPDGTPYSRISLSYSANPDESYTWTCPEALPEMAANGNRLAYYVQENPSQSSSDGFAWSLYGYSHGNYRLAEDGTHFEADDATLASQPDNARIIGNEGCIVIHNMASKFIQMDIQKQFFEVKDDGSWHNITGVANNDVHRGIVLGFTLIRRIVDANGNVVRGWHDYGNEFKVGFNAAGENVMDEGGNNFCLKVSSAVAWEYTILNGNAGLDNDVVGLPSTGVYLNATGETVPVYYQYSYRETGVYSDLEGNPHPGWEWVSAPPGKYKDENGAEVDFFGPFFENHDARRAVNYQAASITLDKRWLGKPDVQEIYVKIYRTTGSVTEDFTEIIANDLRTTEGFEITNWQRYLDDASVIDLENEWIILKSNTAGNWTTTVKTHRAAMMPGNQSAGAAYRYYIREVGYKDGNGNVHLVRDNPNALDAYETRYTRWDAAAEKWLDAAVTDPTDASIALGRSSDNRLQVMNAPMMDLTVSKKWYGPDGVTERNPWNDSLGFTVKQVRTRWEDGAPTNEQETVYLKDGTGNLVFTLHENGQTAVMSANHSSHDTYNMTVADDSNVESWTMVLSGLQRGYFDENGQEWHCTYEVEEVDAVDSIVTYEGTEQHDDLIVIKNTYDEPIKIRIIKVDAVTGAELDGAVFQLKKQGGTEFTDYQSPITVDGSAEIEGLTDGTYRLEEIQAPAGYMPLSEPVEFTVSGKTVSCSVTGSAVAFNPADNSFTVRNRPGVELPNTGGTGTVPYTSMGLAMILLGGGTLFLRKRRALKGYGQS